jgi:conjugal transfer pilus assembly protein TraK
MRKIFLVSALLLNSIQSQAAQVLFQDSPTEATTAIVSRHEPNLITVDGRKIRRIYGAEGLFTIKPEPDTGAAWIKPTSDKPMMSAYITDEDGQHYKLLLKVEDIPAETIIIKGRGTSSGYLAMSKKNEPRNDDILNTTVALFNGDGDSKHDTIPLWKGTRFELVKVFELRGIRGETYVLTNLSDKQIIMDEREFYRNGVQSVAIENSTLEAGQSTRIFIVSEVE